MLELSADIGSGGTSSVLKTTCDCKVWIRVGGTFSSQTLTMKESLDNSTFAAFTTDGTAQAFTAADYKLYDLPGGVYFRFDSSVGGSPAIDVHYSGAGVRVAT